MGPKWTVDADTLHRLAEQIHSGPAHAALDDQAANRPGRTLSGDHRSLARSGPSGGSGQSSDARPGRETYADHHRIARPGMELSTTTAHASRPGQTTFDDQARAVRPGDWQPADQLDAELALADPSLPVWVRYRAEMYLVQVRRQRQLDEIDAQRRQEYAEDAARNRAAVQVFDDLDAAEAGAEVERRRALLDEVWQWSAGYGVERFDPPPAPVKPNIMQRVGRRAWWFAMGAGIGYLVALAMNLVFTVPVWAYMLYWSLMVGFVTSRTGLNFRHRMARTGAIFLILLAAIAVDGWLT
jgi:hypothetical protein